MAQIRGIEVGKVLRTQEDVLEHCYPKMHQRMQAATPGSDDAPAPRAETPPPPVVSSKPKSKKAKVEAKAEVEEPAAERVTEPVLEPATAYEPFKDV